VCGDHVLAKRYYGQEWVVIDDAEIRVVVQCERLCSHWQIVEMIGTHDGNRVVSWATSTLDGSR